MTVPGFHSEIEVPEAFARFHYSRDHFRKNLLIAAGLTGLVCGLTWLLLGIYGAQYMNLYTAIAGLIFFGFISARTIVQYFRNEVVLAIQPTGLLDARVSTETIPWDAIKEIVLTRREREIFLEVVMWPLDKGSHDGLVNAMDISALDGKPQKILDSIARYKQIRIDNQ